MNKFQIESPIFRHSDLKLIGKKINIQKYNNYYLNCTKGLKENLKEFKSKKYAHIDHDSKYFFSKNKNKPIKRSDILAKIIKEKVKDKNLKILDFGCNKGSLLKKLSKMGYKNLYGYDLGSHYKKYFKSKKIIFTKNLKKYNSFFHFIIFSHTIGYSENIEKLFILIKKISKKKSLLFFNIQDIEKRPINFFLGDQKYHFNKKMVNNFFSKYGKVLFIKNDFLSHEILFFLKLREKNKKKSSYVASSEIKKAKNLIKNIKKIKNKCDVLGNNLGAALSVAILKKKIKNIVIEKLQPSEYFLKKKIIGIKNHKKNNIPLLVNFSQENKTIIKRLKQKHNLNKIINIK